MPRTKAPGHLGQHTAHGSQPTQALLCTARLAGLEVRACRVGKSEPGEPITETAVRELYEETGLTVKPESLKVAHIIHGAWGIEAPNGFLTVVFAAHEWSGEPENREPRKQAQVRWVDADTIPEEFVDTTASTLRRYLVGGAEVSLDGWS
ncbi:hypothetical protein GCM10009654_29740 [Streptomyces hebeiensis]|uniref:Nudix hydrolase domain-containing protein n=1 Tax=Streptomyces hebeiensis TaxID=229486 RepID=A0ABP4FJQ0_9ACTN